MKVLITVVMENFDRVREALRQGGRPPPGCIGSPLTVPEALVTQMGGRLLLADLDAGVVLGALALPTPSGLCWPDPEGLVWVASMWQDQLLGLHSETGAVRQVLSLPAFNDLHTVVAWEGRLLITCTGVDALLELDPSAPEEPSWSWWAGPHPTPVPGARPADPQADHRGRRYATLARALHLSSATPQGERVLASAFHTGELLGIDRVSGAVTTLLRGLDHPHALVPAGPEAGLPPGSLLCCESPRGVLRVLDAQDLSDRGQHAPGLRWLQAACPSGRGSLILLDNPNFGAGRRAEGPARVLELDPQTDRCTPRLELPAGWRLFSALPLSPGQRFGALYHGR